MINRAVLTGRLTRDPELRYTTSGIATISFSLAVDRQFRNQNGEREADFINCVIWRRSAENFANFTRKGSLVGIDGRIQTRNYENQQGNRVYVTEVVVDNFALLEPRQQGQSNHQASYPHQQNGQNQGYRNQGQQNYSQQLNRQSQSYSQQGQPNNQSNRQQGQFNGNQARPNNQPASQHNNAPQQGNGAYNQQQQNQSNGQVREDDLPF